MAEFRIADRPVGPAEPTFVIAEAGSNHNGDLDLAKELIDVAADAGADAVKFQTFRAENLYVDDRDVGEESAYEVVSELELPPEWIPQLHDYCQSRDVEFMSTPFDEDSAAELAEYVPAFKIASFSMSHHPLLESIVSYDKPMLVSTGAHELTEIAEAVSILSDVSGLALLHCISAYPTPLEDINVRAVQTLKEEFNTVVGFSDHTTDPVTAPAAAVALGASIVEKHITLDRGMEGPDHSFAIEPDELAEMVAAIRRTEQVLGDGSLGIAEVESGTANRARRSLFAVSGIREGERIEETSVRALRPGYTDREGLPPKYMGDVIGATATEDITAGEPITADIINTEPR